MTAPDDPALAPTQPPARLGDLADTHAAPPPGDAPLRPAALLDPWLRSPEVRRIQATARHRLFGQGGEPTRVDRFVVLDRLGAGGMGVVYAAYDPKLDRKVAIKLLRPEWVDADDDGHLRARLLREAQAMARVVHPNVITVHEVGSCEGGVYVAMEFVAGETLSTWLGRGECSWAQIREVFVAVGRGLAAAHEQGLVHRDFKPDNVMLTRKGDGSVDRVLVLDFGLAKHMATADPAPSADAEADPAATGDGTTGTAATGTAATGSPQARRAGLTQAGAIMGTPAYMAPEQHRGQEVDARADQFAFCVSLFEAVYGRRPFAGETYQALAEAACRGLAQTSIERGPMPAAAHRAMLRGLCPEPSDRFATMEELLVQLAGKPAARRRTLLLGGGLVGILAGSLAASSLGWTLIEVAPQNTACISAAQSFARASDEALLGRAEQAFAASPKPYAATTWAQVEQELGRYANSWRAMHDGVCATDTPGLDDAAAIERTLCLGWRAQELGALTQLFADADGDTIDHALDATTALTPVARCEQHGARRSNLSVVGDEALQAEVFEARAALARAKGLGDAGKLDQARATASTVIGGHAALTFSPLAAEAALLLGRLHQKAGDLETAQTALVEGLYTALAVEHDDAAFELSNELARIIGHDQAHFDQALPWLRLAEALATRGAVDEQRVAAAVTRGSIFARAGRRGEAITEFTAAVTRCEAAGLDPHAALLWLAQIQAAQGDGDGAIATLQRDLAALPPEGSGDGDRGEVVQRIATIHRQWGRYNLARQQFERALELHARLLGDDHPTTAHARLGLARTAWEAGDPSEATSRLAQIAGLEAQGVVDDEALIGALELRARVDLRDSDVAGAQRSLDRGFAIARRRGPDHPIAGPLFAAQARVDLQRGRLDQAMAALDHARRRLDATAEAHHPDRQQVVVATAQMLIARGDFGRAKDLLQDARAVLADCCPRHRLLAEIDRLLGEMAGRPTSPLAGADE